MSEPLDSLLDLLPHPRWRWGPRRTLEEGPDGNGSATESPFHRMLILMFRKKTVPNLKIWESWIPYV